MNQSLAMEPATASHVPPRAQMTKEQQAVVERKQQAVVNRYREQQDAKSKSVPEQNHTKLVCSTEQRKTLKV